jgi:hypothetical protein
MDLLFIVRYLIDLFSYTFLTYNKYYFILNYILITFKTLKLSLFFI